MSIPAVEYARQVTGLKSSEKFVLTTIAHYLNSKSNVAWPSIPTLASDCSMNESTVYRALSKLQEKNLILRLHAETNHHNIYQLPQFDPEKWTHPSQPATPSQPPSQTATPTPRSVQATPRSVQETPCTVRPPNKEELEEQELTGERHQEQNPLSLALQTNPTSSPQIPNIFTWLRYARGRDRQNQPRMTPPVERIFNSISSYARVYGPEAGAEFAREEFESLPPIWQDYLASLQGGIGA